MTQSPAPAGEDSLATRYGLRPSGSAPTAKILAAVVVAALLAWAVWATLGQSSDAAGAIVRSYRVRSEHLVSVTVDITRTSSGPVRCTVTAVATDHTQVGEQVVSLPAGASGTRSVTVAVKTEREATSADVGACR